MAFETGFRELSSKEYFAEPCSVPALSASTAQTLHNESPIHAWSRHPALGKTSRETTKALHSGSLSHEILLGKGKGIVIIEADDYRTKAAQTTRDAAILSGQIPALKREYDDAQKTAEILKARFAAKGITLNGKSELTALWTERVKRDEKTSLVQCRGMMDHVDLPRVYDIKSIRSAHPKTCRKHVENYGYAIQQAAYVSAIETIRPDLVGRVDFVFVFYELKPPYAVTPVRLRAKYRRVGERIWKNAVERWEGCLRTNTWPDYTDGIIDLEPSPWFDRDEMADSCDEDELEEEAA